MDSPRAQFLRERLLPALFGLAALGALIGGALASTAGPVVAQSNCQYTSCSTTSPGVPAWVWASIAAIVIAALVAALLIFQHERRRRRPPAGPTDGSETGPDGSGASVAGAPEATPPPGAAGEALAGSGLGVAGAAVVSSTDPGFGAAAGAPDYVEGPEDVGGPTAVMATPSPASAAAAGAADAAEEPNIDDLMDELDRISGEILKKDARPPKGGGSSGLSASKGAPAPDASVGGE